MEELVLIAKIRKPHGIKGEVVADSFSSVPNRFKKLKRVYLRDAAGELREMLVEKAREGGQGVIFQFKDITDRDQADELRNMEVMIPISERPPLGDGHAYYDEIIGMAVVDDTTGEPLGKVMNVLDMPAGDIYVLDLNGNEHLLTSTGEEVIKLDVKKRELRVRLLEEY